ncbi:MAG TPA: hypothetical protein VN696_16440 [Pyrinomonadaceae bacterium]|nr:hypothetical protein [Pyrinomonadaceae bacterium]
MTKLILFTATVFLTAVVVSAQPQGGRPNLSPEEQNLVRAIMSATDPAAKMKAVAELIQKHPKTTIRPRVAQMTADQIAAITDPKQKLAFAQQYETIFTEPSEKEIIGPVLIRAYGDDNQPDAAFTAGAAFLEQHPDSLPVLVSLLALGTSEVKKHNGKYLEPSIQYGTKAAALFEADQKPAGFDDARWKTYKESTLPGVHQSLGLLYFAGGKPAEAKEHYLKSAQLAPSDPFNFVMLAALYNQDYQTAAKHYQAMPAGPPREEELKKTQAMLDQVIDAYAHAVALAEGNAALAQIRQQYLGDLETYYKYRHGGSTDGMQQLIDKYKPAKP